MSFDLRNAGEVAASEVAQLYIGLPASTASPPRRLANFTKVKTLNPGKVYHVQWVVAMSEVAVWDIAAQGWTVHGGVYTVWVGSSSRDLRLNTTVTLPAVPAGTFFGWTVPTDYAVLTDNGPLPK